MINFVLKLFRNNTPYASFDEAYEALQANTTKSDGEVITARYYDNDGDIQTLVGVVNDIEGEERFISVFSPEHDFGEYETPTIFGYTFTGDSVSYWYRNAETQEITETTATTSPSEIVIDDNNFDWLYFGNQDNEYQSYTSIDLNGVNSAKITSFYKMFNFLNAIEDIDVSSLASAQPTTMHAMFQYCTSLKTIEGLEKLNTDNNTTLAHLFDNDSGLTDVSGTQNWTTDNVTTINSAFQRCSGLTSIDLSNWNTSNVTDMGYLFNNCKQMTSIDLDGWDTSKVTTMTRMFSNCPALTTINGINDFDTSNCASLSWMFYFDSALSNVDLSSWDTSKVRLLSRTFVDSSVDDTWGIGNWNTSSVTRTDEAFSGCWFTTIDLSNWDMSNVTNMYAMFSHCYRATSLGNISGWDVSNVTTLNDTFKRMGLYADIKQIENWYMPNLLTMNTTFNSFGYGGDLDANFILKNDIELDLRNWACTKITSMVSTFSNSKIKTINIGGWDLSNATLSHTFRGAKKVYVDGCNEATIAKIQECHPEATYDEETKTFTNFEEEVWG